MVNQNCSHGHSCDIPDSMSVDIDTSDTDCEIPGPSKKARSGAGTYKTKFNKAWIESYPFISEVAREPHVFFCCKVCNKQISCANMGKHDITRHVSTARHKKN